MAFFFFNCLNVPTWENEQDSQQLLSTNWLQEVPKPGLHCTDFPLSIRANNLCQFYIIKISSVLSLKLAALQSYVSKLLLRKTKARKLFRIQIVKGLDTLYIFSLPVHTFIRSTVTYYKVKKTQTSLFQNRLVCCSKIAN